MREKTPLIMSDSFLKSMTFTTPGDFLDRDCDCEECDNIPIDIRNAIQKRKRLRLQTGPIKRTQQRTLINRHNITSSSKASSIITLWSISMPKNAEPLVEFGSSHRIVWVKRIGRRNKNDNNGSNNNNKCTANNDNSNSILQSIGRGIIGSSDEEKSRKYLNDFTEGSVFLVPSNGGKAIGWIHTSTAAADGTNTGDVTDTSNDFLSNNYDDEEEREVKKNDQEIEDNKNDNNNTNDDDNVLITNPTSTEDNNDGYAVLYVAKIPLDVLDQEKDDDDDDDDDNWKWVRPLINGCRDGLESITVGGNNPPLYYKFSDDTMKILQKAMLEAERSSPKY